MKEYKLDKVIDVGTLYRAETDKAYIVKMLGTTSTTKATLSIAGVPCAEIIDVCAPLSVTSSNLLGPIDLNTLYVVIPPGKTFSFSGSSGSVMRLVGNIIELEPGEVLPSAQLARWTEQGKHYISYYADSETRAAGTVIPTGSEDTIGTPFTCPVGEEWDFNRFAMLNSRYDTTVLIAKQFGNRIYLDDKPIDIIETMMGRLGIANRSAPYPPSDAINEIPFTLTEKPIKVIAGRTLRISFINTDADWTVPAGTTATFEFLLVSEKRIIS